MTRALAAGLDVEVFSNLVHVSSQLWEVFAQPGVRLATSYYADRADQHESITKGRGSYARTKANIAEAVRRSIPLRAGIIDIRDEQRVEQAHRCTVMPSRLVEMLSPTMRPDVLAVL